MPPPGPVIPAVSAQLLLADALCPLGAIGGRCMHGLPVYGYFHFLVTPGRRSAAVRAGKEASILASLVQASIGLPGLQYISLRQVSVPQLLASFSRRRIVVARFIWTNAAAIAGTISMLVGTGQMTTSISR